MTHTNNKGEGRQIVTEIRAGARLYSAASSAEVIVVRAADVELACAGSVMSATPTGAADTAGEVKLQLGKRYEDTASGLLLMCTKAGSGPLTCDGREIRLVETKPLPSSD